MAPRDDLRWPIRCRPPILCTNSNSSQDHLYVCMCVCVCVCVRVRVCVHASVNARMHECTPTLLSAEWPGVRHDACMDVCMHACMHVRMQAACMHAHLHHAPSGPGFSLVWV